LLRVTHYFLGKTKVAESPPIFSWKKAEFMMGTRTCFFSRIIFNYLLKFLPIMHFSWENNAQGTPRYFFLEKNATIIICTVFFLRKNAQGTHFVENSCLDLFLEK